MDSFEMIDKKVLSVANGQVALRKDSPVVSLTLGVVGLSLAFAMTEGVDLLPSGMMKNSLFYVGLVLLVIGFVGFCFRKSHFVYVPTNDKMRRVSLDFDMKDMDKVVKLYNNNDFEGLLKISVSYQAGVQLTAIMSSDASLCFTQLSKYVPYSFVPMTDVRKHEGDESVRVLADVKK